MIRGLVETGFCAISASEEQNKQKSKIGFITEENVDSQMFFHRRAFTQHKQK